MTRRLKLLTLASATALVLAACGGGGTTTPADPGTDSATDSGDAPGTDTGTDPGTGSGDYPDLNGTTLEVAATWSGSEQANFEKVLAEFTNLTGAKVNYTSFGDNAATVLGGQVQGGSPPNVALLGQPALMEQFAKDGHLVALPDDLMDLLKTNYSQSWIDLATVDGATYGVWFKAANKSTIWYNKDIWDGAGAQVPSTWPEFLEALKMVSDSGYAGISIGADVGWPLTDWFENVYLRVAGAEKYDQLTNHEIPWTDQSVTDALTALAELFGDTTLIQSGAAQRTFDETVTEVFGADPQAGTVYEGDFVAGLIAADGNSTVGENALFFDFPSINGSGPAVVGGGDVAVAFTDDEGTMALMKFLASAESAEVWVPAGGLTSPNKSVDLNLYPDEIAKQIADALTSAEDFRFDMSDLTPSAFGGTPGQGFWQVMIDFLNNPADIAGAQEKLEAAAAAAYTG